MRRMVFLLSCVYLVLSLFPAFGIAAGGVESKPESTAVETGAGAKEKETSLYLYYQKYLNPYLNKGKTKGTDRLRVPEPKGSLVSNSSPLLLANKAKAPDSPAAKAEPSPEAKKGESDDKTFVTVHRLDSVGLEAINKTFPQEYRKEYFAELALGFRLSPLVDLSVGKVQKFERSGDDPWGARDDGWRLKLEKHF